MDLKDAPEGSNEGDPVANHAGAVEPTGAAEVVEVGALSADEAAAIERAALPVEQTALVVEQAALVVEQAAPVIQPAAPVVGLGDTLVAGELGPARSLPMGDAPAPGDERWSPSNVLLGVVALLVTIADLGTKEWAKHAVAGPDLLRSGKHVEVIRDHVDFVFARNPGGAWSFLRGVPDGLRRPFFLFVSAAAIVFIVTVYARLERRQWAMRWGLPLALGGAIGNLADRVRYGWVVDFIDIYWKQKGGEFHWPTFNVADIAIVIGVGLMALDLFSLRRMKSPPASDPTPETASGAA